MTGSIYEDVVNRRITIIRGTSMAMALIVSDDESCCMTALLTEEPDVAFSFPIISYMLFTASSS